MKPAILLATLAGLAIHAPRALADPPAVPLPASGRVTTPAAAPASLDACNIVFDSLSKDEADSIPLGNVD